MKTATTSQTRTFLRDIGRDVVTITLAYEVVNGIHRVTYGKLSVGFRDIEDARKVWKRFSDRAKSDGYVRGIEL